MASRRGPQQIGVSFIQATEIPPRKRSQWSLSGEGHSIHCGVNNASAGSTRVLGRGLLLQLLPQLTYRVMFAVRLFEHSMA